MNPTRILKITLAALLLSPLCAFSEERAAVPTDAGSVAAAALPVQVAPNNPGLRYSGRFEKKGADAAICAWSASAVTMRFRGTAVAANLGIGADRVEVILDGKPVKILTGNIAEKGAVAPTPVLFSLAAGLPNTEHVVTLFKCTEASCGNVQFCGFQLANGGAVLPAPAPKLKLEVSGDSIRAGSGKGQAPRSIFPPRPRMLIGLTAPSLRALLEPIIIATPGLAGRFTRTSQCQKFLIAPCRAMPPRFGLGIRKNRM